MPGFFERFGKLKPIETQELKLVLPPKLTAILTFEQILFYSANDAEQAELWRELNSRIRQQEEECSRLDKQMYKIVDSSEEIVALGKKRDALRNTADSQSAPWHAQHEAAQELDKVNDEIRSMRLYLAANLYNHDANYRQLQDRLKAGDEAVAALKPKLANIHLKVSAESPLAHLKLYGVLDYTKDPAYQTWDETNARACIACLRDRLIEDIKDQDVEKVILFSGLHAGTKPFWAASTIARAPGLLAPGIVEVYWTGGADPGHDELVTVLRKEREDLCDYIWKIGMPKEIVKIDIPPGPTVGQLLGKIKGEKS